MPSRAPFLARWSPRIGHRAARLHLLTGPTTTIGIWSAPVWLVLFLVGQGWSRVCAYAVAGFGIACLAFAAICMHLMYKALGARIGAAVWETLAAMMLFDAVFGVPGLILAPVVYAWTKAELVDRGLV